MEIIETENVCSVILFDIRISESELQTICEILQLFIFKEKYSEMREFFENISEEFSIDSEEDYMRFTKNIYIFMMNSIKTECEERFLPDHFKRWETQDKIL